MCFAHKLLTLNAHIRQCELHTLKVMGLSPAHNLTDVLDIIWVWYLTYQNRLGLPAKPSKPGFVELLVIVKESGS